MSVQLLHPITADVSANAALGDQYQSLIASQQGFVIECDVSDNFYQLQRQDFSTENIDDESRLVDQTTWQDLTNFKDAVYNALGSSVLSMIDVGADSAIDEDIDPIVGYSTIFGVDSTKAGSDPAVAESAGEHIAKGIMNAAHTGSYTVGILDSLNVEKLIRDPTHTTYNASHENLDRKITDALYVAADATTATQADDLLHDLLANNNNDASDNEILLSSYEAGSMKNFFQNTIFHMNLNLRVNYEQGEEVSATNTQSNTYNGSTERVQLADFDSNWRTKSGASLYTDADAEAVTGTEDIKHYVCPILIRMTVDADSAVDASNLVV